MVCVLYRAFGGSMNGNSSGGSMSVHDSGYWRLIKTAVEAAKLRRSSKLCMNIPCCDVRLSYCDLC